MKQEYSGGKDFDREHQRRIADLKSFLGSTTYSIGRKTQTAVPASPTSGLVNQGSLLSSSVAALPDQGPMTSLSYYVNPNLIKNLRFTSPGAAPEDRFSTVNLGYTSPVRFKPAPEYTRQLEEQKR